MLKEQDKNSTILLKVIVRCIVMNIILALMLNAFTPNIYRNENNAQLRYGDLYVLSHYASIAHNDIVKIVHDHTVLMAKVLATHSDEVNVRQNQLVINGQVIGFELNLKQSPLQLPLADNQYLVLLEEDSDSQESECLIVERTAIKGKIILVLRLKDF